MHPFRPAIQQGNQSLPPHQNPFHEPEPTGTDDPPGPDGACARRLIILACGRDVHRC